MNKPYANRTPIGFVDNDGYVTPFNGRVVDNMPGRYIYTQAEMDFYLGQQEATRFGKQEGITDVEVPQEVLDNPIPPAPQPPIPAQFVATPMDPAVPPSHVNLTQEQMDALPAGLNGNDVMRQVMSTK